MQTHLDDFDYAAQGFKCGLEIHQQLLTERKLFCRCPAGHYTREHDGELLRHMRPTLSEMGTYDGTALMEFKTRKEIIYLLHQENTCTYEMDDTPPFRVNEQALDIAIEIALLLNCRIVDELHIARKQYLDGSIPAGFQRTAIVGVNGSVPFRGREIRIIQLALEEDACREVSDVGHVVTFRADRLSMPLVEVVTAPDLRDPEEAAAAIRHIGRLLRVTGKVRRGIGAARQDVNVSIAGGTRIEIKGVPRYPLARALTHFEALRQRTLLDIRGELRARGLSADTLVTRTVPVADLFGADRPSGMTAMPESVGALLLGGFAGLLARTTGPGRTLADEFAGRLKVIACLDRLPNLFHSDAWPLYLNGAAVRAQLQRRLEAAPSDSFMVTFGPARDVTTALEELRLRALDCFIGVPSETRQVLRSGATEFERILPGPDRMYPDTDSPPTRLTAQRVAALRAGLSEPPWEREARYLALGLPRADAERLAISPLAAVLEDLIRSGYAEARAAGLVLSQLVTHLRRSEGFRAEAIDPATWRAIFDAYARRRFHRETFSRVLRAAAQGRTLEDILADPDVAPVDERRARAHVAERLRAAAAPRALDGAARQRARMGWVMSDLRGRYDGAEIGRWVRITADPPAGPKPTASR